MRSTPYRCVLLLLFGLTGCEDPALERGVPPPLVVSQAQAVVPLYEFGAGRMLRSQVAALTKTARADRLDASIETLSRPESEAVRTLLLRLGLSPERIATRVGPGNVVEVTRTVATVTPCRAALQPDWLGDVANSLNSLGVCVQANNLAGMVDDPRDLIEPARLAPADGAVSTLAVQRWEQGAVKQPPRTGSSTDAGGSDGADLGSGSPTPSGAAPQSAGAAPANPLLSAAPLGGASGASAE